MSTLESLVLSKWNSRCVQIGTQERVIFEDMNLSPLTYPQLGISVNSFLMLIHSTFSNGKMWRTLLEVIEKCFRTAVMAFILSLKITYFCVYLSYMLTI